MAKIRPEALAEIEAALDRYAAEVREAPLTPATQHTYLLHAKHFVRWLRDDFTPGGKTDG